MISRIQNAVILHLQRGGLVVAMDHQNTAGWIKTVYRLRPNHNGFPEPPFKKIGKCTFDSLMRKGVLELKEELRGYYYYWLSSDYDHLNVGVGL